MDAQRSPSAAFGTAKVDWARMIADLLRDPPVSSQQDCDGLALANGVASQESNHVEDDALPEVALDWDIEDLFMEAPSTTGPSSGASGSRTPESSDIDLSCCGQSFNDMSALRSHNETVHSRHHHCTNDGCNKSFTRPFTLRRHVKAVHRRIRVGYCPYAGCDFAEAGPKRGFTRRDIFCKHLDRHAVRSQRLRSMKNEIERRRLESRCERFSFNE